MGNNIDFNSCFDESDLSKLAKEYGFDNIDSFFDFIIINSILDSKNDFSEDSFVAKLINKYQEKNPQRFVKPDPKTTKEIIEHVRIAKNPRKQHSVKSEFKEMLPKIKLIGVGGGGCNVVDKLIGGQRVDEIECIAVNTDITSLNRNKAPIKIQLGKKLTKGLSAGGNPIVGREAALESEMELKEVLTGANMVIIAAGLGAGTGTGAAPVIAEISKKLGILTLGILTKPFEHEGPVTKVQAEDGLTKIMPFLDSVMVIPNERINLINAPDVELASAFKSIDEILIQVIEGLSVVIYSEGIINRDFSDIKRILTNKGKVLIGTGFGTGENRALIAVQKAVNSPLLEDVNIVGSTAILVQVSAGANFTLNEFNQINGFLQKVARPGAEIIPGIVRDDKLKDGIRVMIIATGFDRKITNVDETHANFWNFINSNFVNEIGAGEYQKNVPDYIRRRLESKPFQN